MIESVRNLQRASRMGEQTAKQRHGRNEKQRWNHDVTRAAIGGAITLAMGAGSAAVLGSANRFETRHLIESLSGVLPYLASAGIGGGASILALMLTLLGVSRQSEVRFTETFYRRILWIARQASVLFAGCILLLLTLAAPVVEADAFASASDLLTGQYYVTAVLTSLISGLSISLIMMLQSTVSDLVMVLGFGVEDHYLLAHETDPALEEA